MRKLPVTICSFLLPREACEAIPWRRLVKVLGFEFLFDFVLIYLVTLIPFLKQSLFPLPQLSEIPRVLLVPFILSLLLTPTIYSIVFFPRFFVLTISFEEYFRKLWLLTPNTSNQNFRLTLKSLYLNQINTPFLLNFITVLLLSTWLIITQNAPTAEAYLLSYLISSLNDFASYIITLFCTF